MNPCISKLRLPVWTDMALECILVLLFLHLPPFFFFFFLWFLTTIIIIFTIMERFT